jgi:hypothetical protein
MKPVGDLLGLAGIPPAPAEAPTGVAVVLVGVLFVLLLEQEIVRAARGERGEAAVRVLSIAVVPLLFAFVVVVAVQLAAIVSHKIEKGPVAIGGQPTPIHQGGVDRERQGQGRRGSHPRSRGSDDSRARDDPAHRVSRQPVSDRLSWLRPLPIVRISGRAMRTGAWITFLEFQAPVRSRALVVCRGRGCPFRRATATAASGRSRKFRQLRRRKLPAGVVVEVFVTKEGFVGKYTRYAIRRSKPPSRRDACLLPGATRPAVCPRG